MKEWLKMLKELMEYTWKWDALESRKKRTENTCREEELKTRKETEKDQSDPQMTNDLRIKTG